MKHELTLYQTIRSGGDGSANAVLMESQELCDWDQDHLDEGWGESCTETIRLESDSPIKVLDEVVTKESYLWDMINNGEELKEDDDDDDGYDGPDLKGFIKEFFPNGIPRCEIIVTGIDGDYQTNNIYVDGVLKHKIFSHRKNGGIILQNKLNQYSPKPQLKSTDNTGMKTAITADQVRDKILNAKGNFVKASWKSNPKPAAAHKGVLLEKHTVAVVQAGVDFANLSAVKMGIENGERGEVGELPWGEWFTCPLTKKSYFPHVITHKDEFYLRLYPSGADNHIPKSVFYVDGVEVTKDEYAKYLTPSEAKKLLSPSEEDKPLCFTIKLNNLLDIPQDV